MISLTKTEEFPELTGIKAIATQVKLEMDQSLYYDILGQRDSIMTSGSPMSLWGSMTQLYKPPTTCQQQQQPQQQRHSNCSTPSTPPYSQTLSLENQMVGPHITPIPMNLVGGNNRPHQLAPPLEASSSGSSRSGSTTSGTSKRGRKHFVDPCAIAPLKKRRIQVELLSPDDRDKVLQKREKNKVAAEKCRVKRREKVHETRGEYEGYLEVNESLDAEIRCLKEERQMLEEALSEHKCCLQIRS